MGTTSISPHFPSLRSHNNLQQLSLPTKMKMTVNRALAILFAVAVFTAAPVYSRHVSETDADEMDVCGRDPRVTDKMRENPRQVIEYLVNHPENQEIQKMLNNHPFVQKVEAVGMDRWDALLKAEPNA